MPLEHRHADQKVDLPHAVAHLQPHARAVDLVRAVPLRVDQPHARAPRQLRIAARLERARRALADPRALHDADALKALLLQVADRAL